MKSVIWTILFSIIFVSCQVDDDAHMVSKERFREIAKLRDRGEINRACTMYQDIVETNYSADKLDMYEADVAEALTQAFNMYQNLGEPYQAVVWLDSLKRGNNAMMDRCKPDLYALYGYALTRIDSIEKAKEMIDSAFVLFKDNLSPERKLKIYAYAAGAYFSQPERSEDVINWCNLALECIPNKDAANRPFLLSMLAGVYQRNGQIDKALNVLNQSLEIARTGGDARSIANTLNTIAQLYEAWHLNQSAEIYTDLSLDEIDNSAIKHPVITGEAYTLKGKLMFDRKDKDAIKFLNRADSICREMSYNMGSEDVDLVMGKYFMEMTDSVEKAKDCFFRITRQAIPPKRIEAYYLLAKLYNQEGKDDIADEMLDSMRVLLDQMPNVEPPIGAMHWALKNYGMRGKVEEIQKLV